MIADSFTSQYLQYKKDTDSVTSLLVRSAKKKSGYAVDTFVVKEGGPRKWANRSRGKARK